MALQHRVIDPILTGFAHKYAFQSGAIAEQLFRTVSVTQYGGQIIQYGDEEFHDVDDSRVPGAATNSIPAPEYSTATYSIGGHRLEAKVPREHSQDATQGPGIDLQRNALDNTMARMMLRREIEAATKATTAANFPTGNKATLTSTDQWSHDSSKPKNIAKDASAAVRASIGRYANTIVVPAAVLDRLEVHPVLLDHFKYTSAQSLTREMIRQYLNFPTMLVPEMVKMQNGSLVDVWGDSVLVCYIDPSNTAGISYQQARPSFGFTLTIRDDMGLHPYVEPMQYDRSHKSDIGYVNYDRTTEIGWAEAGYLLSDVLA